MGRPLQDGGLHVARRSGTVRGMFHIVRNDAGTAALRAVAARPQGVAG